MRTRSASVLGGVVAVFVCAAMAAASPLATTGFNSTEDSPFYSQADLAGQGSDVGDWAGPWVSSHSSGSDPAGRYLVVAGGSPASDGPDQHLGMFGSNSSGYQSWRPMDDWSGDFVFQYDAKLTLDAGLVAGGQIQLEDSSTSTTGKRPLNLKLQLGGFYVNDQLMLPYTGKAGFQSMVGNWVTVKIVCDWAAQKFDLYWTNDTDGSLAYVGSKTGWKDGTFSGIVRKLRIDVPKVNLPTDGMEMDRIMLIPEPVSLSLLAVGGLLATRRRLTLAK